MSVLGVVRGRLINVRGNRGRLKSVLGVVRDRRIRVEDALGLRINVEDARGRPKKGDVRGRGLFPVSVVENANGNGNATEIEKGSDNANSNATDDVKRRNANGNAKKSVNNV